MGYDIGEMEFIAVEIPSHRQALGIAWRKGCRRMFAEHKRSKQYFSLRGFATRKAAISLTVISIATVTAAVIIVCFIWLPSGVGEATDNLERSELAEKALINAKAFMPEAVRVDEDIDYGNDLNAAFWVIDNSGERLGMIVVDRATGSVDFFFDARNCSSSRATSEVKIGLDEATAIAEGFLSALGIDLGYYALESDPLVCVGMEGPPENPIPAYSYEFNYRMQVNGIFVDGEGSCFVCISPADGSIKSFGVPSSLISIHNLQEEEVVISKDKAIEIASEEVKGREILEGTAPVVQTDSVELRYMLMGSSRLVPYWKVTIRYRMDDLADVKDVPQEARYMGGCVYSVSAVDGEILSEGSF